MKVLLIVVVCMAFVPAIKAACGPLERIKVKSQWDQVYAVSAKAREDLGTELWHHIIHDEPKVKEFLTRVQANNLKSHDFLAHVARVFGGFDICISLLDQPETLNAELLHLHDQHNERGIPHEYFDIFLDGLNHVIPNHLHQYDQASWMDCFEIIKKGITEGLTE